MCVVHVYVRGVFVCTSMRTRASARGEVEYGEESFREAMFGCGSDRLVSHMWGYRHRVEMESIVDI